MRSFYHKLAWNDFSFTNVINSCFWSLYCSNQLIICSYVHLRALPWKFTLYRYLFITSFKLVGHRLPPLVNQLITSLIDEDATESSDFHDFTKRKIFMGDITTCTFEISSHIIIVMYNCSIFDFIICNSCFYHHFVVYDNSFKMDSC